MIFTYNIKDNNSTLIKTSYYRKGVFLKILIIMCIYLIIIEGFTFILSLFWNPSLTEIQDWYDLNNRKYDLIFFSNFILALSFLIFGGLQITLLIPLFAHQVAGKMAISQVQIISEAEIFKQQLSGSVVDKKTYCPFCGKLRKTNEDFCIYCGKFIE
ncbi:MAG: hypothetical protein ACFFAA_05005 [Promethearchaeota archaeon]